MLLRIVLVFIPTLNSEKAFLTSNSNKTTTNHEAENQITKNIKSVSFGQLRYDEGSPCWWNQIAQETDNKQNVIKLNISSQ